MTAPATTPAFHIPSKPVTKGASGVGSQRDRRFTDTFYDTHKHPTRFPAGRPFTGEREFTSGTSEESISAGFITSDLQCGAYFCDNPREGQTLQERADSLASAWQAPWIPLAKYFRFNYRARRITFAYDKMIADENEGLSRYWKAAAKLAGENDIIDPAHPLKVPFRIRTLIGAPSVYTGKIRLAQAAQSGDPWLLGFVDEPNEELAQILGLNVQYLDGHRSPDSEYVAVQRAAVPEAPLTPEKVLATPMDDIAKMIADATTKAVDAALAARDAADAAQRQANKDRMAKARAARGTKA